MARPHCDIPLVLVRNKQKTLVQKHIKFNVHTSQIPSISTNKNIEHSPKSCMQIEEKDKNKIK